MLRSLPPNYFSRLQLSCARIGVPWSRVADIALLQHREAGSKSAHAAAKSGLVDKMPPDFYRKQNFAGNSGNPGNSLVVGY